MNWFKKNSLDEMQEQKQQKSRSTGFWIAWYGLLLAVLVQLVMQAPWAQIGPEWLLFMTLCIYGFVSDIRNGIWDRRFQPKLSTNLILSGVAGLAMIVFCYAAFPGTAFRFALAMGALVAALCIVLLQAGCALYRKRRQTLDEPEADEPENITNAQK